MAHVITWDALKSFGFEEDKEIFSDPPGGLSFRFDSFKLSASFGINLRFQKAFHFSGVHATERRITQVQFEMPKEIESAEQAAAWLAWSLDERLGQGFERPSSVCWLVVGRKNFDLLPWEMSRRAYERRPHCLVDRDWMRVAFQKLRSALTESSSQEPVNFRFDGEILKIETSGELIAVPGIGKPWPFGICVPQMKLDHLPKRLMRQSVSVSYWEDKLTLGNRGFPAERMEEAS